jgi:uncharacterized protein YnzC (UPF0291/DUF896 family)
MKNSNQRSYKTRPFWESHIKNWKASSLTQAEYCRQNNLKEKSFTYWKRCVQETAQAIRFVPVAYDVTPVIKTSLPIKMLVKNRYVIEVEDGFTPDILNEILRVLKVA